MKKNSGLFYVFGYILLVCSLQAIINGKTAYLSSAGHSSLYFLNTLVEYAPIAAAIFLLIYLSILLNSKSGKVYRLLSFVFRFVSFVTCMIILVDIQLQREFAARLVFNDVAKYYGDIVDNYSFFTSKSVLSYVIAIAFALLTFRVFFVIPSQLSIETRKQQTVLCSFVAIPFALYVAIPNSDTVDNLTTANIIKYNHIIASEYNDYSAEKVKETQNPFKLACSAQPAKHENYIIYMVESLSAYHSKFYSGSHDWTPELDKLSRQYTAFTNFHANGFTTEDGEIAYLTGEMPIYPPKSISQGIGQGFNGFWNVTTALPRTLGKNGYRSAFVTTADTSFSNTDFWAKSLGFNHVEGAEQPFYEGWPRFMFNSAPDEALVKRILSNEFRGGDGNYFMFAKTVSTHRPFFDPETGEHDEELSMRYADKQLGYLYNQLKKENFFDNGVLIITGDHRAMTPLTEKEINQSGKEKALTHIPLVIISNNKDFAQKTIDLPFQQHDLFNSIKGRVSGQNCTSKITGSMFGANPVPPSYITHRRGDIRNLVTVFAKDKVMNVQLDGDDTRFTNPEIATEADNDVIEFINFERIEGWKRTNTQHTKSELELHRELDPTNTASTN